MEPATTVLKNLFVEIIGLRNLVKNLPLLSSYKSVTKVHKKCFNTSLFLG